MRDFVTLVTGVPRSGTSMLMQMLRAGGMPILTDGVREADEDNPRGYLELAAARRTAKDPSWVLEAVGRAVKLVHALVPTLPEAPAYRVILVRRRLSEVLASQRLMLERRAVSGERMDPNDALPDERLAAVFRAQLEEAAAWVRRHPRAVLLEVDHARILADPVACAEALDRFLGGGLDVPSMAAAVDSALWRQREGAAPSLAPG